MRMRQGHGDSWWCPEGHWTEWNYCPQHGTARPREAPPSATTQPWSSPEAKRTRWSRWVAISAAVVVLLGASLGVALWLSGGSSDASRSLERAIVAALGGGVQVHCAHKSGPEYVCVVPGLNPFGRAGPYRVLTNDNGHTYVVEGPAATATTTTAPPLPR